MRGKLFIFILCISLLGGIFSGFAQTPEVSSVNPSLGGGYSLTSGKNNFSPVREVYAAQLVSLYPSIESISYYDEFLGTHLGYVNAFGGVGSNFLLRPEITYEIVVREELELYIP